MFFYLIVSYLMKCGHIAQGETSDGKPCCVIDAGLTQDAFIVKKIIDEHKNPRAGLEGRKAKCNECGSIVDSSWDLPFFEYKPNSEYDSFYDGCYGWE
jgi:hypothetical protein